MADTPTKRTLREQITHDAAIVASWPEATRRACAAELAAMFRNPGIVFPRREQPK